MEERLDIVVDPTSARRGIDVLVNMMSKLTGASSTAESATTRLFSALNRGVSGFERMILNFKSVLIGFGSVITVFRQLGNEFTRFQAFTSALSVSVGGAKAAREEYEFLMAMANRLGISITSLAHNYSQLAAAAVSAGMPVGQLRNIFESFSVAARVLHMSGQDTRLMFYALTQMVSKGTVSMEELRRQLGEKLPGAMNIAANSVGVSVEVLEAAIRKGSVSAAKFLPILAQAVKETFEGGLPNAMKAFDAEVNRLINNIQRIIIVMMDMGVAEAFTNIIKEFNRVISDPHIAQEFAKGVKDISEGVTEFLRSISGESVRKFISGFVGGVTSIGSAITDHLLPFLREVAGLMKEILIAWATIKGAQIGATLGGKSGKGSAIGGAVGGLAGFLAALTAADHMELNLKELGNRQNVKGKIIGQKPQAPLMPPAQPIDSKADRVDGTKFKKKATLEDVLFTGTNKKDNELIKQTKAYEAALLSLQKVETRGNKFTQTYLDIQAGKFDKLSESQRQNLLQAAALAEQQKGMAEFEKQRKVDKELMAKEEADQQLKAQDNFVRLQEQFVGEEELLRLKYQREIEIINEAERLKMATQDEINRARYFAEDIFLTRLEALRKSKLTAMQKFEEMSYKDKAKTIFGELEAVTAGVAQHNKTLFRINKVAAIANAVINAHEGASKSLASYPWPLAGIMAAIHYAAGFARVSAISSTSFEGGGSGSAPSVAGTTPAQPFTPVEQPSLSDEAGDIQTTIVHLHGNNYDKKQVRELLETIAEDMRDGGRLLVNE